MAFEVAPNLTGSEVRVGQQVIEVGYPEAGRGVVGVVADEVEALAVTAGVHAGRVGDGDVAAAVAAVAGPRGRRHLS